MVIIPKNSVLANPANLSGPKGLPNTRISSIAESSVELMDSSVGVSFDSTPFGFSDNTDASIGSGNNDEYQSSQREKKVDSPKGFKSMLQGMDIPRALSENDNTSPSFSVPYVGLITKAIAIYENNARSIYESPSLRGTKFSIVL